MNSIMQEASSLAKAVEQAWVKAGKPQKFSIRVFEDAEKNFLGITTKPAKIALLFEKEDILHKTDSDLRKKDTRPQGYTGQPQQAPQRKPETSAFTKTTDDRSRKQQPVPQQARPTTAPVKTVTPPAPVKITPVAPPIVSPATPTRPEGNENTDQETKSKIFWTDEMISISTNWMQDALVKMDKKDITFTTEVKRYHLKFSLNKPIMDDPEKQKNLFRNYAYLIMQTVRNRLKKQLKYHKIVLTSDH